MSPETLSAEALRGHFEGRLVRLEPLALAHADGLRAAATDSDMFTWMPVDMASSAAALSAWLTDSLAQAQAGDAVPYAILAADSDRVLGSTRFLELRFEHLRAEIGWSWVTRPAWGTGVNVETKLLLLEHAFERAGLRRVEFKTDARNERSRGALLALGASFEGILRTHMVVARGARRDSAYFSVIDQEWPTVKRQLQARLAAQ
ncbi:MAG: GNAT family N-acetyltransferase [Actinomycetota bacterium]|nr:GNAT family N-acetyltransferase [Actinomycetota bacterium]